MTEPTGRPPVRTRTFALKQLQANAACTACGEVVVFEGDLGTITCGECGWAATMTWQRLLDGLELKARMTSPDSQVLRLAPIKVSMNLKSDCEMNCAGCGTAAQPSGEWFGEGARCQSCGQSFGSTVLEGDVERGQVVMIVVPPQGPRVAAKTFSITCATCGAPLATDGTHKTLSCQFCHATCVVPVSARANRGLDTVFIGLFSDVTAIPRDWAFEDDPVGALAALKAWSHLPLHKTQAEHLLVKHKHNLSIFKVLTAQAGLLPGLDTVKGLIDSTEPEIATWARARMAEHHEALRRTADAQAAARRSALIGKLWPLALALLALVLGVAMFVAIPTGD